MNSDKYRLWQAYLDGELSARDTTEFERSLTESERERLQKELRFENVLGERLVCGVSCPDELWRTIQDNIEGRVRDARPKRVSRRLGWELTALAVAACAALMAYFGPTLVERMDASAVVMAAENIEELASFSEIDFEPETVLAYLRDHDINLELNGFDMMPGIQAHYDVHLLGARKEKAGNEDVVSLFVGCCDRPVKLVVARRESDAAKVINDATGFGGHVTATRELGDYLVAVVGHHHVDGMLDLLVEPLRHAAVR